MTDAKSKKKIFVWFDFYSEFTKSEAEISKFSKTCEYLKIKKKSSKEIYVSYNEDIQTYSLNIIFFVC